MNTTTEETSIELKSSPKFFLSTADRTGSCNIRGDNHSEGMVVFRTPHGYNNIYICTNCIKEFINQS
jgi:hypothetical protein